MASDIKAVFLTPFKTSPLDLTYTSENGKILTDIAGVVKLYISSLPNGVVKDRIEIVKGSVQDIDEGAIQDPAGSAVGGSFAGAGGASGAIYQKFNTLPDHADRLIPIPDIDPGASIFNASTGQGRRVLHTYSPALSGLYPTDAGDRGAALTQIANAYYSAIVAFNQSSDRLGADGKCLNLVPISAKIYAGDFAVTRKEWTSHSQHLDPSYTLAAVQIALAQLDIDGEKIPKLTMSYFMPEVFATADEVNNSS